MSYVVVHHEVVPCRRRYLSAEIAGGFTGRVIGLQAHDAAVHLERFTYRTEE